MSKKKINLAKISTNGLKFDFEYIAKSHNPEEKQRPKWTKVSGANEDPLGLQGAIDGIFLPIDKICQNKLKTQIDHK